MKKFDIEYFMTSISDEDLYEMFIDKKNLDDTGILSSGSRLRQLCEKIAKEIPGIGFDITFCSKIFMEEISRRWVNARFNKKL